ncbi:MAM domain-containing glycosylphosphatidylinositol anchor protein 2 isoform 3-T3 [Synchiropus picturatus]
MEVVFGLLWLFTGYLHGARGQGVYAPPTVRIVHSGQTCTVEEERYSERVYTIREGETLELQCLVTGHPRPQIRWSKTAGAASDSTPSNETLRIQNINRHQGGRYYCKADNGLGSPAIRSIRVDVYYLDQPVIMVHQSVGEMKEQFYFERTVFLRCVAQSNPPVLYTWRRGRELLSQGSDTGVEIYEPFFTQGETKILKLKNLRPQDYANYTCISSVRNVCSIRDRSAHFSLSNRTAPPAIKLLLDDPVVVNPGETVVLVCVASAGDPAPALSWARLGGEELPKRSVVKGGTLTIPAVTMDDGGAYSCMASNNVGNPAKKSTTVLVRGLRRGRFWITPDPYHNDDNIQIGREVKISCQVEATPPEELHFGWLKNGRPLKSSERMVITHTDTEATPGTTNLDIIDLKFTDFGTYTCVASLRNGGTPEISIDVNISSTTVPPELSVPRGRSHLIVQEGDTVDLQCLVSGKPKPIILWARLEESGVAAAPPPPMPDGGETTESSDGILRINNVTREMSGTYRCFTSQYNGFNVKPREAQIVLAVQFPPTVEPVRTEIRQALGRAFSLSCRLLHAHPARLLRYEWKLGSRLLTVGQFGERRDDTSYQVRALNREGYGEYTCDITNEAGAGRCSFLVTGKAYPPEFYYDTRGALWQNRPLVYGFRLQWTQMEPNAVDRILAYRLGIRQVGRWPDGSASKLLCFRSVSDEPVPLVGTGDRHGGKHPEGGAVELQPDGAGAARVLPGPPHAHHPLRRRRLDRARGQLQRSGQLSPERVPVWLPGRVAVPLHSGQDGRLRLDSAQRRFARHQVHGQHGAERGPDRVQTGLLRLHRDVAPAAGGRPRPAAVAHLPARGCRRHLLLLLLLPHAR